MENKINEKLIIFDYSGVLADDLKQSWRAISKILELYDKKTDSLEEFRKNFSLPYWNYFINKGLSPEEAKVKEIPECYVRFYEEQIDSIKLFPDVKDTISILQSKSLLLSIVSQTPRDLIETVLGKYGLIQNFDVILGLYDYKKQKPSPEPIRLILDKFRLKPIDAIYVGDMREDVRAARYIGVKSVAVSREGSYHTKSYLEEEKPDFLIDDIRQLLKIIGYPT